MNSLISDTNQSSRTYSALFVALAGTFAVDHVETFYRNTDNLFKINLLMYLSYLKYILSNIKGLIFI